MVRPEFSSLANIADLVSPAGVGYSWIDGLKAHAAAVVTDEQLAGSASRYKSDTPETKEAYMIRQIFEGHFPTDAAAQTAVRWIPRAVSRRPRPSRVQKSILTDARCRCSGLGMCCRPEW
jgi:asparagine synthetase B (glutamine-hydrolysing)